MDFVNFNKVFLNLQTDEAFISFDKRLCWMFEQNERLMFTFRFGIEFAQLHVPLSIRKRLKK